MLGLCIVEHLCIIGIKLIAFWYARNFPWANCLWGHLVSTHVWRTWGVPAGERSSCRSCHSLGNGTGAWWAHGRLCDTGMKWEAEGRQLEQEVEADLLGSIHRGHRHLSHFLPLSSLNTCYGSLHLYTLWHVKTYYQERQFQAWQWSSPISIGVSEGQLSCVSVHHHLRHPHLRITNLYRKIIKMMEQSIC